MTGLSGLFSYAFMVNALAAGGLSAVLAGPAGWFMVARRESFAGHTFAVVGFAGATGGLLLHLDPALGAVLSGLLAALVLTRSTRSRGLGGTGGPAGGPAAGASPAAIGTVQAAALAAGYLFTTLYSGFAGGASSLLFGSILGVTRGQVVILAVVAAVGLLCLAAIGRPLLFATLDPQQAAARGVPVAGLSTAFLLLLALAATATAQVTGSLLVFALLVAPAAAAQRLTARAGAGVAASTALAIAVVWAGEVLAYATPYPVGFWVSTLGFGAYVLAVLVGRTRSPVRPVVAAR